MSVTIGYKPHNPKEFTSVSGGSQLLEILEEGVGGLPHVFCDEDVGFLRGVAACGHHGANEIIQAIHQHRFIEVKAEY